MTALDQIRRLAHPNATVKQIEYGGQQIRVKQGGRCQMFDVISVERDIARWGERSDQHRWDELRLYGLAKEAV